jgi:hypothetical protein
MKGVLKPDAAIKRFILYAPTSTILRHLLHTYVFEGLLMILTGATTASGLNHNFEDRHAEMTPFISLAGLHASALVQGEVNYCRVANFMGNEGLAARPHWPPRQHPVWLVMFPHYASSMTAHAISTFVRGPSDTIYRMRAHLELTAALGVIRGTSKELIATSPLPHPADRLVELCGKEWRGLSGSVYAGIKEIRSRLAAHTGLSDLEKTRIVLDALDAHTPANPRNPTQISDFRMTMTKAAVASVGPGAPPFANSQRRPKKKQKVSQ